ncbi:hypothetical protein [Methanosphaera sp.]|jgi:hypothetical protein|uniref:hypothetical protein n=1 Tax=Methanosphaera sp. TaxID=2666342 RepID=UPI003D8BA9D6
MFVELTKRQDIGKNVLKPEFKDLGELGYIEFEKTRIDTLVQIINKMNVEDNQDFKENLVKKVVSLCYEYNINYNSVTKLLAAVEVDITLAKPIYSNFGEYGIFHDFIQIYKNHDMVINRTILKQWVNEIKNTLVLSDVGVKPFTEIGKNTQIELDIHKGIVSKKTIKPHENKETTINEEYIFNVCPVRIVEYYDPDTPYIKEYEITFKSKEGAPITLPKMDINSITNILKNNGFTLMKNMAQDGLTASITALKRANNKSKNHKMYTVVKSALEQGFHWSEKQLLLENYELIQSTIDQVKLGLETFLEYATYFTDQEKEYLGTVFKWGLFAPFSYAYKQVGHWIEWIYLQGIGGTGKSIGYGNLVGYMWYSPPTQKNYQIGQGRVDSIPRLGAILSKTTFPICINECESIFEKETDRRNMKEFMKSCIEDSIIREIQGSHARQYKGLASAICTSNGYFTDFSGGGTRRLVRITFTRKEIKTEEHKIEFQNKWKMGRADSPLTNIQFVSHKFAQYMMDNPQLIHDNWQVTVDNFVEQIFKETGLEIPLWLQIWTNDDDNGIDSQIEDEETAIKEYIEQKINSARRQVTIVSTEGEYREPLDNIENPRDYVYSILKGNKVVGLSLNQDKEVRITQNFINGMYKKHVLDHPLGLKQFAENYGWVQKQARINGKQYKIVALSYDLFIEWIYGNRLSD